MNDTPTKPSHAKTHRSHPASPVVATDTIPPLPSAASLGLQQTISPEEMKLLSPEDQTRLLDIRARMQKSVALLNELTSAKSDAGRMITQTELDRLAAVAGNGLTITNAEGHRDRIMLEYKFVSDESRDFSASESSQISRPVVFTTDAVKLSR